MQARQSLGIGSSQDLAQAFGLDLNQLAPRDLRHWIDHTLLKPQATAAEIDTLVAEAKRLEVVSVCVNSFWVPRVAQSLAGTSVRTCTVIGFPLGAQSLAAKQAETERALADGAHELDLVINIGALKSGMLQQVEAECQALVKACTQGEVVKLILETGLLNSQEVEEACQIAMASGVSFVKTSTGFVPTGATVEMVRLMRAIVGNQLGVKASGGIRDRATALAMIEAGASRIGCSASLSILGEA